MKFVKTLSLALALLLTLSACGVIGGPDGPTEVVGELRKPPRRKRLPRQSPRRFRRGNTPLCAWAR